jgi:hypothetical protein
MTAPLLLVQQQLLLQAFLLLMLHHMVTPQEWRLVLLLSCRVLSGRGCCLTQSSRRWVMRAAQRTLQRQLPWLQQLQEGLMGSPSCKGR